MKHNSISELVLSSLLVMLLYRKELSNLFISASYFPNIVLVFCLVFICLSFFVHCFCQVKNLKSSILICVVTNSPVLLYVHTCSLALSYWNIWENVFMHEVQRSFHHLHCFSLHNGLIEEELYIVKLKTMFSKRLFWVLNVEPPS